MASLPKDIVADTAAQAQCDRRRAAEPRFHRITVEPLSRACGCETSSASVAISFARR